MATSWPPNGLQNTQTLCVILFQETQSKSELGCRVGQCSSSPPRALGLCQAGSSPHNGPRLTPMRIEGVGNLSPTASIGPLPLRSRAGSRAQCRHALQTCWVPVPTPWGSPQAWLLLQAVQAEPVRRAHLELHGRWMPRGRALCPARATGTGLGRTPRLCGQSAEPGPGRTSSAASPVDTPRN